MKWECRTLQIKYDSKKHKDWVVERAEEPPLVGLQAIVAAHGTRGWELVRLEPEHFGIYAGFAEWYNEHRARVYAPEYLDLWKNGSYSCPRLWNSCLRTGKQNGNSISVSASIGEK